MISIEWLNSWADLWAEFMWSRMIDSTLFLGIVSSFWLLIRKRASPQFGYFFFFLVLLKLIIPIQMPLPSWVSNFIPSMMVQEGNRTRDISVEARQESRDPLHLSTNSSSSAPSPDATRKQARNAALSNIDALPSPSINSHSLLMLGWMIIVVVLASGFSYSDWRTRRFLNNAAPVDITSLPFDFASLKKAAGVTKEIRVAVNEAIETPMVVGIWKPSLLIPSNLTKKFTKKQIHWIILHEIAHIRRCDTFMILLQKILQILFFFHPGVWLTNRIMDQLREYACDDEALLGSNASRQECGEGFVGAALGANSYLISFPSSLGVINTSASIQKRLLRILDPKRRLSSGLSTWAKIILIGIALLILPFDRRISSSPMDVKILPRPDQPLGLGTLVGIEASPTGNYLLTGGGGGAYLWDIESGEVVQTYDAGNVSYAQFSSDGSRFLTYDWSRTGKNKAIVWETETGVNLQTIIPEHGVASADLSNNGKRLLLSSGNEALLYDVQTGEVIHRIQHENVVALVNFSPDENHYLTVQTNKNAILWNTNTGKQIQSFQGYIPSPSFDVFSNDGKKILLLSSANVLNVWDVKTGKSLHELTKHEQSIQFVKVSPQVNQVITSDHAATFVWDIQTGEVLQSFDGVTCADYSFQCDRILLGGEPGYHLFFGMKEDDPSERIQVVDLKSGDVLRTFTGVRGSVTDAAFSANDSFLIAASAFTHYPVSSHTLKVWNVETGVEQSGFSGHANSVGTVEFSPDGSTLFVGHTGWGPTKVRWWDVESGDLLNTFEGGYKSSLSPDGRQYLIGIKESGAKLFDLATGKLLREYPGECTHSVEFSPDGSIVLVGDHNGTVKLWDESTHKEIQSFKADTEWLRDTAFSPDGSQIATGGKGNIVELWNVSSGECLYTFSIQDATEIRSVAFSPDGTQILAGTQNGPAVLWDKATKEVIHTFKDGFSVAFSSDGKRIATGCIHGKVNLFDVTTGNVIQTLIGHTDTIHSVTFSPDGKYLASGSGDGTVRIWDVSVEKVNLITSARVH